MPGFAGLTSTDAERLTQGGECRQSFGLALLILLLREESSRADLNDDIVHAASVTACSAASTVCCKWIIPRRLAASFFGSSLWPTLLR